MYLMHEELARARCREDRDSARQARLVKALRAHRRAARLESRARKAVQRASAQTALLNA